MTRFRTWLVELIAESVLEAMKRRDMQIDAALDSLKGTGGQANANRYDQLQHGRLW